MVKTSRTTSRPYQIRTLNKPYPLNVQLDEKGYPGLIQERQKWIIIASIQDHWRVDDEWWRDYPISRIYYEAILEIGKRIIIYLDQTTETWYRIRD